MSHNLPKDHRKILYKQDPSSTTTHGWTFRPEREEAVRDEIARHWRWVILKVTSVNKKGY